MVVPIVAAALFLGSLLGFHSGRVSVRNEAALKAGVEVCAGDEFTLDGITWKPSAGCITIMKEKS